MQLGEEAFEVCRDWPCVAAILTGQVVMREAVVEATVAPRVALGYVSINLRCKRV